MTDQLALPTHPVLGREFEILGVPTPQGSKTRMPNGHVIEGRSAGQRAIHRSWRDSVTNAARNLAYDLDTPLDGPLHLTVEFRFPMPKSRPKRIQALGKVPKTSAPDLDKLLRSLGDGLEAGGLIRSDAHLCAITATKVEVIGWTGAVVTLRRADDAGRGVA